MVILLIWWASGQLMLKVILLPYQDPGIVIYEIDWGSLSDSSAFLEAVALLLKSKILYAPWISTSAGYPTWKHSQQPQFDRTTRNGNEIGWKGASTYRRDRFVMLDRWKKKQKAAARLRTGQNSCWSSITTESITASSIHCCWLRYRWISTQQRAGSYKTIFPANITFQPYALHGTSIHQSNAREQLYKREYNLHDILRAYVGAEQKVTRACPTKGEPC